MRFSFAGNDESLELQCSVNVLFCFSVFLIFWMRLANFLCFRDVVSLEEATMAFTLPSMVFSAMRKD